MSKKSKIIILVTAVVIASAAILFFNRDKFIKKKNYTHAVVLNQADRTDSKSASYEPFCDGFLRYSRDGIAYYSPDNVAQWNASYELQSPIISIRGEYCAVAGAGSSMLYVFNRDGLVMSVDTIQYINAISMSAKGYVAVILEDANAQYIDMYDTIGEKVYHIKTSISGNGVPSAMSVSDDAAKLVVSYLTIEGNTVNTSVAFYNFGEVGKNEPERLVGGFDQYDGMYIPTVEFVNSNTVVAFATGKISIYTISQYPKLVADIIPESEIREVFYSNDYIGIIYSDKNVEKPYALFVYDVKGNKVCEIELSQNYRKYQFIENNILMYDDFKVILMDFNKQERFEGTFVSLIDAFIPVSGDDTYVYINSRKVQKIQLE